MDETPEQKFDRISRAVQESILRNYPNPERKGCPGDDVVREVAARTELKTDDAWEHITHCSPCYAEFLEFKKAIRHGKAIRRRTAIGLLAAATAAIPIMVITRLNSRSYDRQIGDWNLEASASSRGPGTDTGETAPQRAEKARGYIRVHLPLGSEPGEYKLQIRKSEDGPAVQQATATAEIINGHTQANFAVDLDALPSGSYFAAIRGSSRVWRVYPLIIM
jgi:hypothetical protein